MFENLFGKNKPCILAVDDDESIGNMIKALLESRGCQVDIALDGEQAVNQFKNKKYDLIIMDVHMPKRDGLEALELIRALPGGAGQDVIMLTSESTMTKFNRAFDLGALDYISKPFILEDLVQKVKSHLKNKT